MTGDAVGRHLRRFDEAVAEVHGRLVEAVEREVLAPLAEAASRAAEEHARLVRAADLEALVSEARSTESPLRREDRERERVWRLLRGYREDVRSRVLEPFRARLAEVDPGRRLADRWAEAREALGREVVAAPEAVDREEPTHTYARRSGDSPFRRGRKALVRARRGVEGAGRGVRNLGRRVTRRAPAPAPVRRQSVPVRTLFRYHASVRLQAGGEAAMEALDRRLARVVGDGERDMTVWSDALLEVDALLDRPAHHAAPGAPPAPVAAPEAGEEEWQEGEATGEGGEGGDGVEGVEGGEGGEGGEIAVRLEAAVAAAAALDMALDAIAAGELAEGLTGDLEAAAAAVRPALLRDIEQVGTFMLDPARRVVPEWGDGGREHAGRETRTERWERWFREVVNRLALDAHLERVRNRLLDLLDACEADLAASVVAPARETLQVGARNIETIRDRMAAALDEARVSGRIEALRDRLATAREEVTAELRSHVLEPLGSDELAGRIREQADGRVGEIHELLESLPDGLTVHPPAGPLDGPDPDARHVAIRLRPIAEQAYDAVLLERFRVAPDPLTTALARARTETRQLESVLRFNLDSALDELDGSEDLAVRLDGARELALNGVERTLHTLAELGEEVDGALPAVRERLFAAHARGWAQLHDRVRVEDRMQEQILDLGYRLRSALRNALAEARGGTRRATRSSARLFRRGKGRALRLVRLGQTALEGERITEEQKRRTIDALSTVEEVLAHLPLVYRRLFSFQPVSDPGMLEGRTGDLDVLSRHFDHWRKGLTDAFVVTGYDGNGRTSFLNVVEDTVLRDADVRRVRLMERVMDEADLVQRLAAALAVDGPVATLDGLAARLLERPRDGAPTACIVENLEHLLLRTSAGNGLIGPFLAFMSRADSCVFWLATLAEPAWRYLEKVEATTAPLVRRHALTPMSRADLEAMIINRHLRSGLDLAFEPPVSPTPLLRRRLARARGEEERQAILRSEYFDQLARLVGQNLLLALLYWVRSVSLDAGTGVVRVRGLDPVSFAFMDDFTLSQSFTLKAFLDHATLTLDEHDRIFRLSRQESRNLFESLGNLLVIEPAETRERVSEFVFTTVDEDRRYRIRPLVVHPVLVHLRAKHIVS